MALMFYALNAAKSAIMLGYEHGLIVFKFQKIIFKHGLM